MLVIQLLKLFRTDILLLINYLTANTTIHFNRTEVVSAPQLVKHYNVSINVGCVPNSEIITIVHSAKTFKLKKVFF